MAIVKSIQTQIFGKTTAHIGVRRAYPKGLRLAAINASKKKNVSNAEVADMFNVHPCTVGNWRRAAGIQGPVPAGIARHQAAAAATKSWNTPTLVDTLNSSGIVTPNNATHLLFRGKTYKI